MWASIICLLPGMMVMSPSAAFLLYSLAAILAVFPAIMAKRWQQITSIVLLCASMLLAFESYPQFKKEIKAYRTRTMEKKNL